MDSTHYSNRFLRDDQTASQPLRYTILKQADMSQRQLRDITDICSTLFVSRAAAIILLHGRDWNASKLFDKWFEEEDEVGLMKKTVVQFNARDIITCGICFYEYACECESVSSTFCGHPFCRNCWTGYIRTSIDDGLACLMLKCPEPPCGAAVGPDLIGVLTTREDYERYKHFLLRSYFEGHRKIKWCPAPDCCYAVEYNGNADDDDTGMNGSYDVTCLCSNSLCWNCCEEIHRPVNCRTVGKWILKNKDDSHNVQWILVNTKPCPKCKRPIEKNQGCNTMTCRPPCYFRFCWYCLEPNVMYGCCNRYVYHPVVDSEAESDKKKAKIYLGRYIHYYERWANNRYSKRKAIEDLHKCQLRFIVEAWQQIIESRQVLQWTYAYSYLIPEDERFKVQFFEHLQGYAEFSLERLHKCAERERERESFQEFRLKLIGLTKVTGNYFEKLVRALENGLPEVDNASGIN
ncbi:E3 ubiquitin-protein ligase ARI8 [Pyrus ussuriensis x Pyrus communis]|uniref:RBR-type E3 ubiquitin transferase n=1 Tax=Pyrus ussuriensis x Pyrus communis TaxID=2448454 RepID=A0A5N5HJN6_9ROSA|nr:E3 ubiquitin-protein ligase ARI8 [Pyrus ussuriensis x Pyrus communis]